MASFLNRFWQGLKRTRDQVGGHWRRLVGLKVSPEFWDELEQTLYEADLGAVTVDHLVNRLKNRLAADRPVNLDQLRTLLYEEMMSLLPDDPEDPWHLATERPQVWIVVGVNGTGKTTSVAKLAWQFKNRGQKVLLGAADTFRAAATEQITVWAGRIGVDVVRQEPGADPAAVAFDTVAAARNRGMDLAIIDTAGRLHTKTPLMQELGKITRVVGRELAGAPHEIYLVLDATTGQNGIQQARVFSEAVGPSGIILTKLDGTAKGGVVFAIQQLLGIPVRWVGVGETSEDLIPFKREDFVRAVLGQDA